jgi:Cupin-like domain
MDVTPRFTPIQERAIPDAGGFQREIVGAAQPVVFRGLVADWEIVERGRESPASVVEYLRSFDNGRAVDAILTPPQARGRIFYDDNMTGFNFARNRLPVSEVAAQVLRYANHANAPAVAMQSAVVADCLPGMAVKHELSLVDSTVLPRIWLGNAITTPTHLDEWNNIACVACGRRRFTLFPPEQIANLYIGPLDYAPTGAPMSLVSLHEPDFSRFPRFREALTAAVSADLAPGDAIFIPPLWWHHVESLDPFNLLINYWWHELAGKAVGADSGFDSLLHAILNLRPLTSATRAAWSALFDHYVFGTTERSTAHIPEHRRGVLGTLSDPNAARVRAFLSDRLQGPETPKRPER